MLRRVLPTHDQTAGTTQLCRERSDFRWLKADQSKLIQPLAESLRERELGQRAGSDASLGVFVRHWVCRSDQAACLKASCSVEDGLGDRLGVHVLVLRDALNQAQMLFVEVSEDRPGEPSA